MNATRRAALPCPFALFALLAACQGGTNLAGDVPPFDSTPDAGSDEGAGGDDGASDVPDDAPGCRTAADCDDGVRCNGFEVCLAGLCTAGTPPGCDDGVDCTEDICLEDAGGCRNEPRDALCPAGRRCGPDGCRGTCLASEDCDDGEPCNGGETCLDGLCAAGPPMECGDDVDCTVDGCLGGSCWIRADHLLCGEGLFCDPERGCVDPGACAVDVDCDDGDPCNGPETCAAGTCVAGPPPECDDGDPCNGLEACIGGICASGPPPRCDDGDPCNGLETCAAAGCVPGIPPACDDGLFCNGTETCGAGGACRPGRAPCDDALGCTSDGCDEATDRCWWSPADRDGDGHGDTSCGGDDCDDERDWAHPGASESCRGGIDEDCDGLRDCADEVCADLPECCVAAAEECNGEDDDCDGVTDDGLSCFVSDGRVLQPYATDGCGPAFYSYDTPRRGSANLAPDVTVSGKVVVLVHQGPPSCGTVGEIVAVADRVDDGSGGSLKMEWASDPRAVAGVVLSDDPGQCRYRADWGTGRCTFDWEPCCTDGAVLGDYTTDFCVFLRFIDPVGIDEVRVLDGAGGWISHGFDAVFSICRMTVPAA